MSDGPFVSFLLVADTQDGMTTFAARTNTDAREEFVLGPIRAAEATGVAEQLAVLAKHGFDHKLLTLARYPTEISHTEAQLTCSVKELLGLGFRPSCQ